MRALLVLTVLLAGCSGSPTAPTPVQPPTPPPTRVTVSGTITDTLSGASVGTFSQEVDRLPTLLPVSLAGFVTRQAWVTSASQNVDLIREAGFDLGFYRQLARNGLEAPTGLEPLRVLSQAPSIYLQTAGLTAANVAALEQTARATIPAMTGGRFTVTIWETGVDRRDPRGGWLTVKLESGPDGPCGVANIGATVGDMMLNTRPACGDKGFTIDPSVFAHELGHALGFYHTASGLMQANVRPPAPSTQDRTHAAIAYRRLAGSRDVDVDPTRSALLPSQVVVD